MLVKTRPDGQTREQWKEDTLVLKKSGQGRKFASPFHGPYRIIEMDDNTAKIRRVDQPQMEPILVALDRLRSCPEGVAGDYWPTGRTRGKVTKNPTEAAPPQDRNQAPIEPSSAPKTVAVEGRDGGEVT